MKEVSKNSLLQKIFNVTSLTTGDVMYLYHYYEKSIGPFKSLSDIPREKAERILDWLREKGDTFASKRGENYIERRKQLEAIVRRIFMEKGGKPLRVSPHYMVVEECPYLLTWYREPCFLRVPIQKFNPASLSFTYGDMFPTFDPKYDDGKEYRKNVYTYWEILKLIDRYGIPQIWNSDGRYGPERYIEVQVWSDEAVKNYISIPYN